MVKLNSENKYYFKTDTYLLELLCQNVKTVHDVKLYTLAFESDCLSQNRVVFSMAIG